MSSDSGIITPSLALTSFKSYFNYPDAPMRGAIVSIYQAGGLKSAVTLNLCLCRPSLTKQPHSAWLGSASVGITSDRLGRRKAIAFGCAWGVLGGALMAGAAHVAMRESSSNTPTNSSPNTINTALTQSSSAVFSSDTPSEPSPAWRPSTAPRSPRSGCITSVAPDLQHHGLGTGRLTELNSRHANAPGSQPSPK